MDSSAGLFVLGHSNRCPQNYGVFIIRMLFKAKFSVNVSCYHIGIKCLGILHNNFSQVSGKKIVAHKKNPLRAFNLNKLV